MGGASEFLPEHRSEADRHHRGRERKPTGIIDVALIQSLVRNGEVADIVADYGHLSSMNATICPQRASNWWLAVQRRGTSSACPRQSPARMVTIRSSSCNAVPFAIG